MKIDKSLLNNIFDNQDDNKILNPKKKIKK